MEPIVSEMTSSARPSSEALCARFGATLNQLLQRSAEEIDSSGSGDALLRAAAAVCDSAYRAGVEASEFALHKALYALYRLQLVPGVPGKPSAEGSSVLCALQNLLEHAFMGALDRSLAKDALADIPSDATRFRDWLYTAIHAHPAHEHPLYADFMRNRATMEDVRFLLERESTVDAGTDDFIALLQLGVRGQAKMEMARNYWDEMGNGDPKKVHSLLFEEAASTVGIRLESLTDEDLEAHALACGNLQLLVSMRRKYLPLAIGYFAVLEYMAPQRFTSLMEAWRRNGLSTQGAGYHEVHIEVDVDHAAGWFKNVVGPALAAHPASAREIARGALYRLRTSQLYLDSLLPQFPSLQSSP